MLEALVPTLRKMEAESDDGEGTSTVTGTPLLSDATAWQFMYLT